MVVIVADLKNLRSAGLLTSMVRDSVFSSRRRHSSCDCDWSSDVCSSDLPANYTFVAGDNGAHTFTNGVTLKAAGTQSITATDTVTGTILGTESGITVNAGTFTKLQLLVDRKSVV